MKNFLDAKEQQISDKAFSHTLLVSVASILLCLVALCSMTYAWFSGSTSSGSSTLASGSFDVTITVVFLDENGAQVKKLDVAEDPSKAGVHRCELEKGEYLVTLQLTPESMAKGHCLVRLGGDSVKHTAAIVGEQTKNRDNLEKSDPFTFTVRVDKKATLTLEPRWGMVVSPDIVNKGAYPASNSANEAQEQAQ